MGNLCDIFIYLKLFLRRRYGRSWREGIWKVMKVGKNGQLYYKLKCMKNDINAKINQNQKNFLCNLLAMVSINIANSKINIYHWGN